MACFNSEFPTPIQRLFKFPPKKDSVYTIRGVGIGRGNDTRAESGQQDGEIGGLLVNLLNPRDPSLRAEMDGEFGFSLERFAALKTTTEHHKLAAEKEDEVLPPA